MEIVRTRTYLSGEDQAALELSIASDPAAGDAIKGLKGVRKLRFGRGKRGGGRAKNEQADLSHGDRRVLLAIVEEIEHG